MLFNWVTEEKKRGVSQRRQPCIYLDLYLLNGRAPTPPPRCLLTLNSLSGPCLRQVHHVCVVAV